MDLTIVIPFFNGHTTIERLLEGLPEHIRKIIIDDVSDVPYSSNRKNVEVFRLERKGYFAGAVNAGIERASGDVLILNQDAILKGTAWLDMLEEKSKTYAMIGERIKGTHPVWNDGYIHGTFMYIRRDAIDSVGLLEAEWYPLWGGTCEYQLRLCRKGYEALPLTSIPGFDHSRQGKYGSSITQLLKREPGNTRLFIRVPPEISVIIPNCNYGRFLPDAINSLIGGDTILGKMEGQSFQSFEVIIVDDASTDNSKDVIESLVDPRKGIRAVYLNRNAGTSAANNAGIRASFGKYIAILGADDMMESWRLEELYRAAIANPHSIIYDNVMPVINGKRQPDSKIGVGPYNFDRLLEKNHIHAGILFPREAWYEVGGYPAIVGGREDWAMNVALGRSGYCGIYIPKKGYLYRRHEKNRTIRNTTKQHRANFLRQIMDLFPDLYTGKRPEMCCGNGRTSSLSLVKSASSRIPEGSEGMTLLQYVGKSYGTQTFYGPVTGKQYSAGLSADVVDVDPRDLRTNSLRTPGLLEIKESGRNIFVVYQPKAAPAPPPVKVVEEVPALMEAESQGHDLTDVPGVGQALARKLKEIGIVTVDDLAEASTEKLHEAGITGSKAFSIIQHAIGLLEEETQ